MIDVKRYTSLQIDNRTPLFKPPEKVDEIPEGAFAHLRIVQSDRVVVVRGDPKQSFVEFLLSLVERAGEPTEIEELPSE